MRELTYEEVMCVGGGSEDSNTCTWDVVVGYVGATIGLTMAAGPVGFAVASVGWFAAATSMHNNC